MDISYITLLQKGQVNMRAVAIQKEETQFSTIISFSLRYTVEYPNQLVYSNLIIYLPYRRAYEVRLIV